MLKKLFRKARCNAVDDLLDQYELPSFPSAVLNVLSKLRDPEVPLQNITDELEVDPGLHVRTLRTVNSVAFGLPHKISNLSHATSLLGRSRLESLVLSVVTKETIDRGLVPGWFDMKSFWFCSTRRAALARSLSQLLHPSAQAEAFTAGLLQDMAIPVIAAVKSEEYRDIYQAWQKGEDVDLVALEMKRFGVCHPHLGASLAERWGFPESLVHNVFAHHATTDKDVDPAVSAAAMIIDQPSDYDSQQLAAQASRHLGIEQGRLEELIAESDRDAEELYAILC